MSNNIKKAVESYIEKTETKEDRRNNLLEISGILRDLCGMKGSLSVTDKEKSEELAEIIVDIKKLFGIDGLDPKYVQIFLENED